MAKSIYEILADLTTTTSVPGHGSEIEHTIPEQLFPTDQEFESADLLLEWAEQNGFTHALLQKGIQKGLIDIRATFKSCKKNDEWSIEYGQNNVDAYEWTVTERPNQNGSKAVAKAKLDAGIQMANAMKSAGIDDETIIESLTPVYGEDGADLIMATMIE